MTKERTVHNMPSTLQELGAEVGLVPSYVDFWGQHQTLSDETLRELLKGMGFDAGNDEAMARALAQARSDKARGEWPPALVVRQDTAQTLPLSPAEADRARHWRLQLEDGQSWQGDVGPTSISWPQALPLGYHQFSLTDAQGRLVASSALIVCPARCFQPDGLRDGERWWGPTVQLYALRSERNWGMGDFTDLGQVVHMAVRQGAAFVGLNPVHALFPHEPERASPYSPSSRQALNTMYIDVEAIADFDECETAQECVRSAAFQQRLHMLREAHHIDYTGVAAAKQEVLNILYAHFRRHHLTEKSSRGMQFRAFQQRHAPHLRQHALFDALQAHCHEEDPSIWGWTRWPLAYQAANSQAVQEFEAAHRVKIEYNEYLQWQAHLQLHAAAHSARSKGMPLGLYMDVAVGVNEGGAETWSDPGLYALGLHVGAPREEFNPAGQDWGLPPWIPSKLQAGHYQPFIDTLRANMRHAGALRLDHAMSLARLFWVPPGAGPAAGTYMRYPLEDLIAILALESHRQRCIVIGEDLGTVPEGFRECMAANNVLSYRPLYFERQHDGGFRPPAQWPVQALAVVGTHDLPTLRAWWRGEDIDVRARLGLFVSDEQRRQQVVNRANERVQLLWLLESEGLWPQGSSSHPDAVDDADPRFTEAVHALVARSKSQLVSVQFEDVVQQLEQVNVPSTTEAQHPNWRVKLAVSLDELQQDARWQATCQILRQARPRAGLPPEASHGLPSLDTALIPRATYRVQFNAATRFEDVTRAVPYLSRLGISHLYASPYLKARAGSTHGYDIVDHNALNPEIGDERTHNELCEALSTHGMHQLLDIVPNHMGVLEADNAWWQDVLACGPASKYAKAFDIDWASPAPELRGKVLLPVLGDHYGIVLEAGELQLGFDAAEGEFALRYYGHRFPIDPRNYPDVFGTAQPPASVQASNESAYLEVRSMIDAFGRLPTRDDAAPESKVVRQRDKALLRHRLATLYADNEWVRLWIQACLDKLNGHANDPRSFDALDALIDQQAYRLAFWRVASDDVNYRRFFDISTLAALRTEDADVFEATHHTVMRWLAEGRAAGLRVDHPDGLSDPQAYFQRLQTRHAQDLQEQGKTPQALYIAVEKILAEHERVPDDWLVHGGTGYRFANVLNGLFVDAANEAAMSSAYDLFIGEEADYDAIVRAAKLLIMSTSLSSDLQIVTTALHRIAQTDRRSRDFTRNGLRNALVEITAGFPVYRSYITERGVSQIDRRHLAWACAEAKRRSHADEISAIDYVRDIVLHAPDETDPARQAAMLRFVRRWQQFTAPVMAKAVEDTAFYRYHRLLSLNDVGGDPRRFGLSPQAFHAANQSRMRFFPHTMLGTSTHDSKRTEDVRARLNVLSEQPEQWLLALQRWRTMNRPMADRFDAEITPNDEYLLYQTLVGIWPLAPLTQEALDGLRERVLSYMIKAAREAKTHTSWINPNLDHEAALSRFITRILGTLEPNPFLKDVQAFVAPLAKLGCLNSLNQVVLKLTSPGMPDVYQGCETWQFNLVDPDNRRPVDFTQMATLLDEVQASFGEAQLPDGVLDAWLDKPESGHIKMLLTWRLLTLRRMAPRLFAKGSYRPLDVGGQAASHVVAYQRQEDGGPVPSCVVITSRLLHNLDTADWQDTTVTWASPAAATQWVDWLTGRRIDVQSPQANTCEVRLSSLFSPLPMAVLVPASNGVNAS
ncbi:MAG: malto-oligosyltrehalose synthase [Aquabacterium sp.]